MKQYLPILLLFATISCQTKNKESIPEPPTLKFTSFEMSYDSGWHERYSIYVDSSWTYIIPNRPGTEEIDNAKSGSLPDSLITTLNEVLTMLAIDTSLKSNSNNCDDCSVIAVKAIIGEDTVRLYQVASGISPIIRTLIPRLGSFIDSASHKPITSAMNWETMRRVAAPPPPPIPPRLLPPNK